MRIADVKSPDLFDRDFWIRSYVTIEIDSSPALPAN